MPCETRASWAGLAADLRADRAAWTRRGCAHPRLRRGYHAVLLYRLSRLARERGWPTAAWLLWLANHAWTKADLPPSSRIGGGLFLPRPAGVVIAGAVGSGAVVGAQAVVGGLLKDPARDIGGGPGLPVIGDGAVIEAGACILGPVRVGEGAYIGPGVSVRHDVEPGRVASMGWPEAA